jgi:hypothetical protein
MSQIIPNVFAAPRDSSAAFARSAPTLRMLALAAVWGIERNLLDKFKAAIPPEWLEFDLSAVISLYLGGALFGCVLLFVVSWTTAGASWLLRCPVAPAGVRGVLAASAVPRIGSVALLTLLLAWTGEDFYRLSREEMMATMPASALGACRR